MLMVRGGVNFIRLPPPALIMAYGNMAFQGLSILISPIAQPFIRMLH